MAILTSVLRVIYDQEETKFTRILLESLICGTLTLTVGSALRALGYEDWYMFCGGAMGFMGSQTVRALAYKIINKKVG